MRSQRLRILILSLAIVALPLLATEIILRFQVSAGRAVAPTTNALVADRRRVSDLSRTFNTTLTSRGPSWPQAQLAPRMESPIPTPAPSPTPTPPLRPPINDPRVLERVRGFVIPLRGARLPIRDNYLPGAPRPYRWGTHEGMDFYDRDAGVAVGFGTEVLAAQTGRVVQATLDYREVTREEIRSWLVTAQQEGHTPPAVLDRLRGRHVVLDHGDGVVTRYNHLDSIAGGIVIGSVVKQGQVIGTVGNSGTPEAAIGNKVGPHLDFEIRIDGQYLGWGLTVPEIRLWLENVFAR